MKGGYNNLTTNGVVTEEEDEDDFISRNCNYLIELI
jgi:hypothetical protein